MEIKPTLAVLGSKSGAYPASIQTMATIDPLANRNSNAISRMGQKLSTFIFLLGIERNAFRFTLVHHSAETSTIVASGDGDVLGGSF